MRSILSILLFTCLTLTSFAQIPIPIDSICRIIKQNSIHAKEANWVTIQDGLAEKLTAARTDVDSIQSLVYVFEQLQDYHSSIIYNGRQFSHYPEFDDSTRNYLLPLVQLSRQRTGIFMAKSWKTTTYICKCRASRPTVTPFQNMRKDYRIHSVLIIHQPYVGSSWTYD